MPLDQTADFSGIANAQGEFWRWLRQELGMRALLATPAQAPGASPPSRLSPRDRRILAWLFDPGQIRDHPQDRAARLGALDYKESLRLRSGDLSGAPDAILEARSSSDILKLLAVASELGVIVKSCAGDAVWRGLTPGAPSHAATIALDLSSMNAIESIDRKTGTAWVQAGVGVRELSHRLSSQGFALPYIPERVSYSSLGHWIAADPNSGGSNNHAENPVLGWEAATPVGILDDKALATACTGLRDLMIGSREIFGIITRAQLQLQTQPSSTASQAFVFADFAAGVAAAQELASSNVRLGTLECFDLDTTRVLATLDNIFYPPDLVARLRARLQGLHRLESACLLIVETTGSRAEASKTRKTIRGTAARSGAIFLGSRPAEHWRAHQRQRLRWREAIFDHGLGWDTIELHVSWQNLHTVHAAMKSALRSAIGATVPRLAHGLVLGQISGTSIHGAVLTYDCIFPRALEAELSQADIIRDAAAQVMQAHADNAVPMQAGTEITRAIKKTVDPKGILNPSRLPVEVRDWTNESNLAAQPK